MFTRLVSNTNSVKVGHRAGTVDHAGYRQIKVNLVIYKEHRLAWLYVYGEWPEEEIDHINGNKADNRLINLRTATRKQNARNRGLVTSNTSGFKGVSWDAKNGKWLATATVAGIQKHIGRYATPEQAHQAYCDFVRPLHGEYFRAS